MRLGAIDPGPYYTCANMVATTLAEAHLCYLPPGCSPVCRRSFDAIGPEPDFTVVGNPYPGRTVLLNRLLRDGLGLVLYSTGTCRWLAGGPATGLAVRAAVIREAKTRVLRQAASVLNKFEPSEMAGVNARLFEARGSGGAVLCEPRRALTELLVLDAKVLALRNYLELVAAPLEARAGGDVADQFAHAGRTYERRTRVIPGDVA